MYPKIRSKLKASADAENPALECESALEQYNNLTLGITTRCSKITEPPSLQRHNLVIQYMIYINKNFQTRAVVECYQNFHNT